MQSWRSPPPSERIYELYGHLTKESIKKTFVPNIDKEYYNVSVDSAIVRTIRRNPNIFESLLTDVPVVDGCFKLPKETIDFVYEGLCDLLDIIEADRPFRKERLREAEAARRRTDEALLEREEKLRRKEKLVKEKFEEVLFEREAALRRKEQLLNKMLKDLSIDDSKASSVGSREQAKSVQRVDNARRQPSGSKVLKSFRQLFGDDEPDESDNACSVCLARKKCVFFEPCNHLACCMTCTRTLTNPICPMCRKSITHARKLFV